MLCGPLGCTPLGDCVTITELRTPLVQRPAWDCKGQISVSIKLGLGIIFPLSGDVCADLRCSVAASETQREGQVT